MKGQIWLWMVLLSVLVFSGCIGGPPPSDQTAAVAARFDALMAVDWEAADALDEVLSFHTDPFAVSFFIEFLGVEANAAPQDIWATVGTKRSYTFAAVRELFEYETPAAEVVSSGDEIDRLLLGALFELYQYSAAEWEAVLSSFLQALQLVPVHGSFSPSEAVHAVSGKRGTTAVSYAMDYSYIQTDPSAAAVSFPGQLILSYELDWTRSENQWYVTDIGGTLHIDQKLPLRDLDDLFEIIFVLLRPWGGLR